VCHCGQVHIPALGRGRPGGEPVRGVLLPQHRAPAGQRLAISGGCLVRRDRRLQLQQPRVHRWHRPLHRGAGNGLGSRSLSFWHATRMSWRGRPTAQHSCPPSLCAVCGSTSVWHLASANALLTAGGLVSCRWFGGPPRIWGVARPTARMPPTPTWTPQSSSVDTGPRCARSLCRVSLQMDRVVQQHVRAPAGRPSCCIALPDDALSMHGGHICVPLAQGNVATAPYFSANVLPLKSSSG
jgi:hypothetical protein